jgi:hypothetical protein
MMNKTFLLTAVASYTEGTMLLVIDSLDDFVAQFVAYHTKKREFLLDAVPEFFERSIKHTNYSHEEWWKIVKKHHRLQEEFRVANNCKPFDFEFRTGCSYIEKGRGEGNFYNNLKIVTDPDSNEDDCWKVVRQFMSDLPTGTHYCGDYCS